MPFVTQEHRDNPDQSIAGDRCYIEYKKMVDLWQESPRWSTADVIATRLLTNPKKRAQFLAFLIFFNLHVMPYEIQKRVDNGEV